MNYLIFSDWKDIKLIPNRVNINVYNKNIILVTVSENIERGKETAQRLTCQSVFNTLRIVFANLA